MPGSPIDDGAPDLAKRIKRINPAGSCALARDLLDTGYCVGDLVVGGKQWMLAP